MEIAYNKIAFYSLAQLTLFVIGIIKVPLFTSLFQPAEMGAYSWCVAFLAYIDLFFLTWINATLWRFVYNRNSFHFFSILLPTVIPLLLLSTLFAFLFIFIFAYLNQFNELYNDLILIGFFTIVTQQMVSFYLFFYQAYKNFKTWSFLIIIQQVSTLVLFFLLYYVFHFGIRSIFYASFFFNCFFLLLYSLKYFSKLKLIIGRFSLHLHKTYFKYSLISLFISLCLMLLNNGDRFIISLVKGETELGLYSQYYGLATFGFFSVVSAFNALLGPAYNAALVNAVNHPTNLRILELYILLFTPIAFFLGINSAFISKFLLDVTYHGYTSVFTWTLVGLYFFGLYNLLETRMKFLNKLNHIIVALVIVCILNLGTNYLFLHFVNFEVSSFISFSSYFLLFGYLILTNFSFVSKLELKNFIYDILFIAFIYSLIHILINRYLHFYSMLSILLIKAFIISLFYYLLLNKHNDRIKEALNKFI